MTKQQRAKVLLQALDQLPVDFFSPSAVGGGGTVSGVFIRRRALTFEPDHFAETLRSQKHGAGDEGDTRWIRPRWSTFPVWTDTDEKERRRKRRGGGEGGENSGCTDCRQLITCGPEAHTHARTHTYVHTNTHNSSFLDEATPKTEGWFMRRSRPMGIRACSGIRRYEKKK